MTAGRTVSKYLKCYIDGFDFSTYFAESDALTWAFDAPELHGAADAAKGYLPNDVQISPGKLVGVYDTTASTGPHVNLNSSGVKRTVSLALGGNAAPGLGDPVFAGQFYQSEYTLPLKKGQVPMTVPFPKWAADGATLTYGNPWGQLLNANVARTAANAGVGTDNLLGQVSTLFGGYLVYHITAFATAGSFVLSVDDSADNSSFAALTGATTGSLASAANIAGVIAIGRAATVRRYLRWQLALTTTTSLTFHLSFHRAYW